MWFDQINVLFPHWSPGCLVALISLIELNSVYVQPLRIRDRNAARIGVGKAPGSPASSAPAGGGGGGASASATAEKLGYVPRARVAPVASGLSSTGMSRQRRDESQELNAEATAGLNRLKQKDAEIDEGYVCKLMSFMYILPPHINLTIHVCFCCCAVWMPSASSWTS